MAPVLYEMGEDGLLYTTIARQLIVFDPNTLSSTKLVDGTVNLMDLDNNGNVYYAKGSSLFMLPVPLKSAKLQANKNKPKIKVNEPLEVSVEAILANGKTVDNSNLKITYHTNNPSIIEVVDGQIIGKSIGHTEVHATIDFKGSVITTEAITVRVQSGYYPKQHKSKK